MRNTCHPRNSNIIRCELCKIRVQVSSYVQNSEETEGIRFTSGHCSEKTHIFWVPDYISADIRILSGRLGYVELNLHPKITRRA